ncbi:Protein of unknown function, partial [Gryllus bimaculatus]
MWVWVWGREQRGSRRSRRRGDRGSKPEVRSRCRFRCRAARIALV